MGDRTVRAAAWLLTLVLAALTVAVLLSGSRPAEDRARSLEQRLRCPSCQSVSVAESPSQTAEAMRATVREQVAAGRSDEEIVRFLHDRYGDFVLLRPPVNAATLLLWATPALALALGVGTVLLLRRRRPAPTAALTEAERRRLAEIEGEARPATGKGGAA